MRHLVFVSSSIASIMTSFSYPLLSLPAVLFISACQKPAHRESFLWEGQGKPPEYETKSFQFSKPTDIADSKISFAEQSFFGAKVQGSYIKKIESSNPAFASNNIKYIAGSQLSNPNDDLKKQVIHLEKQKSTVVPDLQRKDSRFKDYRYEGSPEVIISFQNEIWEGLYSITYSDKNRYLWQVLVDKNGLIRSEEKLGSHFVDGIAYVFPESPKVSDIREVILKDMNGDNSLTSQTVSVLTESAEKARGENNLFKFSPPQDQFEQVQVYHYIAKSLDFFKESLGVKIPFQIKALTNIGYPEKTNTAFYYQGQIRIGSGDGIVFSKMPLDPSIVMHETGHALVDAVARLPYQGDGGSINEGFADFYTTVQLKSPYLGDSSYQKAAYKRTVANEKTLADKTGGLYADSLILSGTFWQIKEMIGEKKALEYSLNVLMKLNPQSDFKSLQKALIDQAKVNMTDADHQSIEQVLKRRGWL